LTGSYSPRGVIFVDRTNSGASPTSALHTALAVNGILLAAAALACLLSARAPKRDVTNGT
jgi:hypothetical protein